MSRQDHFWREIERRRTAATARQPVIDALPRYHAHGATVECWMCDGAGKLPSEDDDPEPLSCCDCNGTGQQDAESHRRYMIGSRARCLDVSRSRIAQWRATLEKMISEAEQTRVELIKLVRCNQCDGLTCELCKPIVGDRIE